jgi:hypothetical protein
MPQMNFFDSIGVHHDRPPAKSLAKTSRELSACTLAFETKLHSHAAKIRDVLHIDVPRNGIDSTAAERVIVELEGLRSRFSSILEEMAIEIRKAVEGAEGQGRPI